MPLLPTLLRLTAFRSPLLRTLVPSVALAYTLQTGVALPSIALQTERFYDLSGSLTYLSCTALSLALPYLRGRASGAITTSLGEYLSNKGLGQPTAAAGGAFGGGSGILPWWWRQALLSAAVALWATRLGTFLFKRISADNGQDSRFDSIRASPLKFYGAFLAQATWVSLCLAPVLAVNSIPRAAFAAASTGGAAAALSIAPYATDALGLMLYIGGLTFETIADRQKSAWLEAKRAKKHSEEFLTHGLWSKSRHPNYFGEVTLWTGIAVAAAGTLVRAPAQTALGLSSLGGLLGKVAAVGVCAASPAFVAFLVLKVSGVPLSEGKYDGRFGGRRDYREWKERTPMFVPKVFG